MISRPRSLAAMVLAALFVVAVPPVQADQADDARAFVEDRGNALLNLLDVTDDAKRKDQFRDWLERAFALDLIGQLALGPHRGQASQQQLSDYDTAFEEYIVATYNARFRAFTGYNFKVVGARPAGKRDSIVSTTITGPGGEAYKVDFRVRAFDEGQRIIDVAVDNLSMLQTQREEFASVIQQMGIDGLTARLKQRTDEVLAKN